MYVTTFKWLFPKRYQTANSQLNWLDSLIKFWNNIEHLGSKLYQTNSVCSVIMKRNALIHLQNHPKIMPVLLIRHMDLLHCFREFCFFCPLLLYKYTIFICLRLSRKCTQAHMVRESTSHHPVRLTSHAKQSSCLTNIMMRSGCRKNFCFPLHY